MQNFESKHTVTITKAVVEQTPSKQLFIQNLAKGINTVLKQQETQPLAESDAPTHDVSQTTDSDNTQYQVFSNLDFKKALRAYCESQKLGHLLIDEEFDDYPSSYPCVVMFSKEREFGLKDTWNLGYTIVNPEPSEQPVKGIGRPIVLYHASFGAEWDIAKSKFVLDRLPTFEDNETGLGQIWMALPENLHRDIGLQSRIVKQCRKTSREFRELAIGVDIPVTKPMYLFSVTLSTGDLWEGSLVLDVEGLFRVINPVTKTFSTLASVHRVTRVR